MSLVLCALCNKPAAWFNHGKQQHLCDDCDMGLSEPLWQSLDVPLSRSTVERRLQMMDDFLFTNRRLVLAVIEMAERGEDVRALLPKIDVANRKGGL